MKSFKVEVKETLARCIIVKAENQEEAIELVKQRYSQEDIVLGCEDYVTTEYAIREGASTYDYA